MHNSSASSETLQDSDAGLARVLAECRALRAECERLQLIMDNAPVLLAYFDTEHRYRYVNAAYALRFGGKQEVLDRTVASVLGQELWSAIKEHRERVVHGEALEYEVDVAPLRGEQQYMHCVLNPARSSEGRVVGYVAAIADVTDRKRVVEARDLLAAIVESSDDAIVSMTLDGRITSWNAGATSLFGYTAEQMVGQIPTALSQPGEEQDILDRIRRGERVRHYETTRFAKDGRRLTISLSAAPMRDHAGSIIGVATVARDITEAKEAEAAIKRSEEALREADRRKDEFLALLAHELRNPLATLVNGLHLLRPAAADPAVQKVRDMMDRQLAQLQRLVDDLLDVSRISRGRFELRRAPVSLALAVETAIEGCQSLIAARRHTTNVDIPTEPLLVEGDFARLAQVFANLLSNSAKYTEPGGRIEVAMRRIGTDAVVTVRDTGIGIPSESLATVFDMFSQVQDHKHHAGGGLGIGLALVKSLVQMHSGSVEVQSDGPGQGTAFTIRLPLLHTPETAEAFRLQGVEADPERSARRRVLIADDNADAASSLALILQMQGHQTLTAGNGREAVDLAATFRPDVIFMDLGMPHMDGLEATRQIRAQPWGRSMVIVALTGWGQEGDRRQTRDVGMDLHVVKPINLEGIAAALSCSSSSSLS
jgi:two-component system, chemotaxis family, CheB/CheR fusion protein